MRIPRKWHLGELVSRAKCRRAKRVSPVEALAPGTWSLSEPWFGVVPFLEMKRTIIDSHAHLGWDSFAEDRNEVIQRAFDAGVVQMVQAGVDLKSAEAQLEIAKEHPKRIFNGIGLHPHEAKDWNA